MAAEVFKQKRNLTKQTKDLLIKIERGSAGNAEGDLYIILVCSWEIKLNCIIKNYFRGDVVSSNLLLHNLQVKTFKSGEKTLGNDYRG